MLMTFLSPPKAKEVKAILLLVADVPSWTSQHSRGLVLMQRSCLQVRILMSEYFFYACVVFAQIGLLIKIVHLLYYLTVYVSKLPCGTHTKSNWKWIPKYADCDV
jgi:hypothetical protein